MILQVLLLILNIAFLGFISWWLWKKEDSGIRRFYWPALTLKVLAGTALGIIYSTYYTTSDSFTFFYLAADKADLARTDFSAYVDFLFKRNEGYFLGEYRTFFFIRVTSVFALLTYDNYWITAAYYSALSFFSAWHLTKIIARLFPDYAIAACIAFLFFPSVVFWSSGVIKESLAMAAMYFLIAVFIRLWSKENISIASIVLAIFSGWVIFNLKYYYLAVFVPVSVSVLLTKWLTDYFKIQKLLYQILLWIALLTIGFELTTFLHPNFSPHKLLTIIVSNNKVFMDVCTPDDVIHFYNLTASWKSMIINSPWALLSGCFRPFVWEANTVFKFITSVENLALIVLAVLSVSSIKNSRNSPHRLLVLSVVLYCAILCIFLALSTPNFGTLARYRVGFLPFVVLLVVNRNFITNPLSKLL